MPTTITLEPDQKRGTFWYRYPRRGGGLVTKALIATSVVLFVLMVLRGLIAARGLTPVLNPDLELLIYMGAQNWALVLEYGQWWRCLTYAFTHGGLLHLAFNMVALYQVGQLLEREAGRSVLLFLYTFCALTAVLAGYLWHPAVSVVGASGSLFGLIGFSIIFYRRLADPHSMAKSKFMVQWAVFAFLFGYAVNADNAGHLGGALGGALVALVLPPSLLLQPRTPTFLKALSWISGTLIVICLLKLVTFWVKLEMGM